MTSLSSSSTDMQQNWILVDYENVQPPLDDLLRVLKCKCSNSRIMMFIGATQKKLPTDMTASLQEFGERVKYVPISSTRKNALDFHIAFYIGRLSAQHPDARFVIVSRDTGFDPLIQYCKAEKIHVVRKENVSGQTTQPNTSPPKTEPVKTQGGVKAKKKQAKAAQPKAVLATPTEIKAKTEKCRSLPF